MPIYSDNLLAQVMARKQTCLNSEFIITYNLFTNTSQQTLQRCMPL